MNKTQANANLVNFLSDTKIDHQNLFCHALAEILKIEEEDLLVGLLYQPYATSPQQFQCYLEKPKLTLNHSFKVGDKVLLGQLRQGINDIHQEFTPQFQLDNAYIIDKWGTISEKIEITVEKEFLIKDKSGNEIMKIDIENKKIELPQGFDVISGNLSLMKHHHQAGNLVAPPNGGTVTGITGEPV